MSEGERGRPGERGPVGDHGQAGDKGRTGDTGLTGDVGLTGDTGETGDKGDIGHTGKTGLRGHRGPVLAGPLAWVILVVIVTLVFALQGCDIRTNQRQARENRALIDRLEKVTKELAKVHVVQCRELAQDKRQLARTNAFLQENVGGLPQFGLTRGEIKQTRDELAADVEAASILKCPPTEEIP